MTPLCIENTHYILQLTKHFAPDPDISETFQDTPLLQWGVGLTHTTLEVGNEEYKATFWNNEGDQQYAGPFSYDLITFLKKALTTMYPEHACP